MILKLYLRHTKESGRETPIEIYGIDANKVAHMRQDYNKATFALFISDIIKAKLPTHYYNFEVVNWELIDHRGQDHTKCKDEGDTPLVRQLRSLLHPVLVPAIQPI